jgi:hypothetical protein
MALKENDISFFKPMWIRGAISVFLAIWLGWELLYTGDMFWASIVGLVLVYFVWNFFIKFPKGDAQPPAASSTNTTQNDEEPR